MRRRWLTDTSISPRYLSDGERGAIAGPPCMKKRALLISEGRHKEGWRKRVTALSQSEPDEGHGAISQDEQKPMSWNCLHTQFTSTVSRFPSFIMSAADDFYVLRYYHTRPNERVHICTNSPSTNFITSGLGEQWKGSGRIYICGHSG